jgi:plastocyanin
MHRLPIVGLACLVLVGCGDDESDSSSTPAAAKPAPAQTATSTTASRSPAPAVEVSMKDIEFVPHNITAKVGQRIVWTNNDSAPHNVTATDGADFASDTVTNGQTYEYTPTKSGVIQYVCTIHSGQDGEIRVNG